MSRFSQTGDGERRQMLRAIGAGSVEELFRTIPAALRLRAPLDLPPPLAEDRLLAELGALARLNGDAESMISFLGAGMYDHFVPSAVAAVAGRSELATAYTPYQAEASQGTLQIIFEYQTLMCELTGLDVANASLYDGGSAMAEAALLAAGATRRRRVVVLGGVHPLYVDVARTYAVPGGIDITVIPAPDGTTTPDELAEHVHDDVACVIAQQPSFFGLVEEMAPLGEVAHRHGALFVAVVDPVSLGILQPPGAYGADVAVGEGQGLGLEPSFGGPGLGFFAARKDHLRRLPGRLVGETVDARGRRGFVLTLQTREQHIRRERATSNICTNQGLMATASTIHMCLLGRRGIRELAEQCVQRAHHAADELAAAGAPRWHRAPFFRELVVRTPVPAAELVARGVERRLLAGVPLARLVPAMGERALLVAVTERRTRVDIERLATLIRETGAAAAGRAAETARG